MTVPGQLEDDVHDSATSEQHRVPCDSAIITVIKEHMRAEGRLIPSSDGQSDGIFREDCTDLAPVTVAAVAQLSIDAARL